MTIIEIRPFRNGWQVYECVGVQPVFLSQEQAIYQNTNAILTVEPHTPGVPDQGSTCVLLTLGLLGLVTFRRQLLRGQT
jgi:hypothetical protein